jgi:pSer/pThr/pTyr-binding forkhead associated (FHA) protein
MSPLSNSPENDESGTRLESVEDIRRWAEQAQAQSGPSASDVAPSLVDPRGIPDPRTPVFRPSNRPPMALLAIVDDGGEGAEWIRIRGDELNVGRVEGDILIPHDESISGKHLKIYRRLIKKQYRWVLKDLESTNGTFVRISTAVLKNGQELQVGGSRFRFEAAQEVGASEGETPTPPNRNVTQGWEAVTTEHLQQFAAGLVELTPTGDGARYTLSQERLSLGSGAGACEIRIENDPFVSPRHAELFRDRKDRWNIRDVRSRNGTWLRIAEIPIKTDAEFQAGEQRFHLKVLSRHDSITS